MDTRTYLMLALSQDKQSLVSICNSIIDSCKPFAEDKEMVGSWDKRLPRTGAQWKAVVICLFSWLIDIDFLSWHLEEISRKAKEGPPSYAYANQIRKEPKNQPQSTPIDIPIKKPPMPHTYLPLNTGYLPGRETFEGGGYSELALKYNSDSSYHVQLYKRFSEGWSLACEDYLKPGEEFVINAPPPPR
jgi:hypothetical protein